MEKVNKKSSGDDSERVINLLNDWRNGDPAALDALIPIIEEPLRAIAYKKLGKGRVKVAQVTSLVVGVHEEIVMWGKKQDWKDADHFYAVAALVMRRILTDRARKMMTKDEKGEKKLIEAIPLDSEDIVEKYDSDPHFLLALDGAINKLKALDPVQAYILEIKISRALFGVYGDDCESALDRCKSVLNERIAEMLRLTDSQLAKMLNLTDRQVRRKYEAAKLFLARELDLENKLEKREKKKR